MPLDYAGATAREIASPSPEAALRLRNSVAKRAIDISGACASLIVLGFFLVLVAVAIKLESRGPALFRQRRTGCGGRPFVIYKFRTMTTQDDGDEIKQAEPGDQRLTRIGAFLRRSSIDELPQILNVLKGDMSLVGPRPHAVAHDRYYASLIPEYEARFAVRPGITGLAQIAGFRGATPNTEVMAARVAYDLEYIHSWSLRLDLNILWKTLILGPFDPMAF